MSCCCACCKCFPGFNKLPLAVKIIFWILIVLLSLGLLFFILVFVVFPLVFMNNIAVQRFMVFWNVDVPSSPQFKTAELSYGIKGVNNLYITVKEEETVENLDQVTLGTWFVAHKDIMNQTNINATRILSSTNLPIVLYLHGVASNRVSSAVANVYEIVRTKFHIVAPDYRNYGDSTPVTLSETGVVHDAVEIYKWIRMKTGNSKDIYIWGHSLGASIAIHTAQDLTALNIPPKGLIIESAFSSLRDEVYVHPLASMFAWLAYFEATIVNPLEQNGLIFNSTGYIRNVKCPILQMHSEDDTLIPITLGRKLFDVIKDRSNVKLIPFDAALKHGHLPSVDPNVPGYVGEFFNI